jgi:DNA-binding response OmpR family regulator
MPQRSVLLVEDEPLVALDVEMALTRAGFRVLGPAPTTATAMSFLRRDNPDLTILDLHLGDGMAFPLMDFMAKTGRLFVILSGHSRHVVPPPHRDRPYVQKPHQENALLQVVEAALKPIEAIRARAARS